MMDTLQFIRDNYCTQLKNTIVLQMGVRTIASRESYTKVIHLIVRVV